MVDEKITSERMIYDKNTGKPKTKIIVYESGRTVERDLETGQSIQGSVPKGTKASQISIPEKGIQSYQQQRAAPPPEFGTSTREGYVLSTGEVTQDIQRAKADIPKVQEVLIKRAETPGIVLEDNKISRAKSFQEGFYTLSTGEVTRDINKAREDADKQLIKRVGYGQAVQASRFQEEIKEQPKQQGFSKADQQDYFSQPKPRVISAAEQKQKDLLAKQLFEAGRYEEYEKLTGKGVTTYSSVIGLPTGAVGNLLKRPAVKLAGTYLASFGIGEAGRAKAQSTLKSTDIAQAPEIYSQAYYETSLRYSQKAREEYEKAGKQSFVDALPEYGRAGKEYLKGLGFQIGGGQLVFGKDKFAGSVERQLKELGYTDEQIKLAVPKFQKAKRESGVAELGSFVVSSTGSEQFVRSAATKNFKKLVGLEVVGGRKTILPLIKATVPATIGVGALEGAQQELVQQRTRETKIKPFEIAKAGAFGAVTAGTLQSVISGTAVISPTISKTTQRAAYAIDPIEYAGDVSADLLENFAVKRGTKVLTPTVTVSQSEGKKKARFGVEEAKPKSFSEVIFGADRGPKPKVKTVADTYKTSTFEDLIKGEIVPSTIKTKGDIFPETIKKGKVPTFREFIFGKRGDTPTETITSPEEEKISTNTQTTADTFTDSFSFTPSVTTPQGRIIPPIPLFFGSGASTGKKAKRKGYVNELEAAVSFFNAGLNESLRDIGSNYKKFAKVKEYGKTKKPTKKRKK